MEPEIENRPPRPLIEAAALARRVTELAAEIDRDYSALFRAAGADRADRQPLLAVGVLKGSVFFLCDLLKQLTVPVAVDFLQTSSYGAKTSPGEIRILKDVDLALRGRDVLLVEDIVDTGYTLQTILALLRFRGARSVKLCALLDKRAARRVEVPIDYCGFVIQNHFVVGYGLDAGERHRNLPYIGIYDGEEQ